MTICGATVASSGATAAGITDTTAIDVIREPHAASDTTESCYARYAAPQLGLVGDEHVLRDGYIGGPLVLNGEEWKGLLPNEIILRVGRLTSPVSIGKFGTV